MNYLPGVVIDPSQAWMIVAGALVLIMVWILSYNSNA